MPGRALIAAYMMTNKPYGALYTGMTAHLVRRIVEHREGLVPGFTRKWGLKRLVWWESFELITDAIQREKTVKHYVRDWKTNLIEAENPRWEDLFPMLLRITGHDL